MPPPIDPAIDMLSFSPAAHVSSLDQWAFELVQNNHPLPNRTPADALQTWLFPLDSDILASGSTHMTIDQHFDNDGFRHPADSQASPSGSSASIASRIPRERFARVESCWPSRNRKSTRLMPTLWQSLVTCDSTNILSEILPGAIETPISERERRNSRWGLDEECRETLQGALNNAPQMLPILRAEVYGDTASSAGDIGASPGVDGIQFPPAEILDIAMEMYLYYFHPTLPIIHIPTFSAKNAPRTLLLTMCLIGLSILGTAGASKFVSRTFPVGHLSISVERTGSDALHQTVMQMVSAELQSMSTNSYPPQKQLRIIATSLLALNLASITGRKSRIAHAEKLYNDLMTVSSSLEWCKPLS
jgi:hypothetical protein